MQWQRGLLVCEDAGGHGETRAGAGGAAAGSGAGVLAGAGAGVLEIKYPFNRGNPMAATPPREPTWYYMPQVRAAVHQAPKDKEKDWAQNVLKIAILKMAPCWPPRRRASPPGNTCRRWARLCTTLHPNPKYSHCRRASEIVLYTLDACVI